MTDGAEAVRGHRRYLAGMLVTASRGPLAACLAATVAIACQADPSAMPATRPLTEFPHAMARPDCAPWDGPAISILLTLTTDTADPPATPFVHVGLYESLDRLLGRTIRWPAETEVGAASWCHAVSDCVRADSGVVLLDALAGDSVLAGRLRLGFPERGALDGAFRAVWRPTSALCG